MNIVFDLVFVALLALNIFDGYRKGFVRIILSFAAVIVTWFVASGLSMPVAEWAIDAFVRDRLIVSIENLVADSIANGSDALIASIPDYIANLAETAGVSLENLAVQLGDTIDPAAAAIKIYEAVENNVVISVVRIISFFALYAVMNVVMSVVIMIICKVCNLPILKSFNRLLGSVVGGLRGVIIVAVVSIVLSLIAMLIPESPFAQSFEQSVVHGIVSDVTDVVFGS